MAAPYSNRQLYRKTPNPVFYRISLAQYFQAKSISLALDFDQLKENTADELQDALNTFTDNLIVAIEGFSGKGVMGKDKPFEDVRRVYGGKFNEW